MNHVYRLVWSNSRNMLVAVAEIAGSRSKGGTPPQASPRISRARVLQLLALTLAPGLAHALPTGGTVVAGQASLQQSGQTLDITQTSQNTAINWQSFSIGSGQTVNFLQPNAGSIALNRIVGSNASAIYGHLNANGQVFLVNPNGVFFAPGAQVNVGGIVASTLNLSNQNFLSGNDQFSGSSTASVVNQGRITAKGGTVAFIANSVDNQGAIATPGGSTALGAGSAVKLVLAGNQLLGFQVSQPALQALAQNGGVIQANGGAVILSAQARNALLQTVVNNTGVIQAQTVADHGGTIELLGGGSGSVNVAGTLDASAPNGGNGGQIETSGQTVEVASGAVITTQAPQGQDGNWTIDPNDFTIAASGGDETGAQLTSALSCGNVTIESTNGATAGSGNINVDDTVSWSKNTLTLDADNDIDINTAMNGSGTAGLALQYGQGSASGVTGGSTATVNVNAPVNLASTGSFSTRLGSGGATINYTIITSLGSSNSTTGTDLQGINGKLAGDYVLGANIDASATSGWNGGAGFAPIGSSNTPFSGVFNGLGHAISGLTIDRPGGNDVGLFGYNTGTISNVGVVGGSVTGSNYVGGLAGDNNGTISNAYATGSVSGGVYVGGLVGSNYSGTISNAYATGSVTGSGDYVGGLVGENYSGMISDAYATGSVSGSIDVGGLVGSNFSGTISNAYATGSVSGNIFVGGLVGENYSGTISDAYATGSVTGSSSNGGLVGYNFAGTISNAYWDTNTGGATGIGGGNNTGATGLSTASLASALPAGFSSSTWGNANNQTTPYLLANASFGTVSGSVILGTDSSATPTAYGVILTLNQLQDINTTGLAGKYVLGANIDASATSGWNGGAGFAPIGNSGTTPFSGVFNGLGFTISGLTIDRPGGNDVGLFGYNTGTISNVGVVGGSVSGSAAVGGLVGVNLGGTISDAYAAGSVTGSDDVGGLVGANGGTISDAYATGSVTGSDDVGGLVGDNFSGPISNAYATGSVSGNNAVGGLVGVNGGGPISNAYATGSVSGNDFVGGLVGSNYNGPISNAYAAGSVTGSDDVGGLVGANGGPISDAYATGSVTGSDDVGGLVGVNGGGPISNAYATGSVTGSGNVGGLVGYNSNGTISNAYWDTNTGGATGIGGGTTTGATGLSTASLASALPAGFSSSTWGNANNQTTPYLLANASFGTVSGSVILGTDSSATPTAYGVILTLNQLQDINTTGLAGKYVLGANIDASATSGWNGGAGFAPIGNSSTTPFSGVFNGLGFTISGLTIDRPDGSDVGLFGYNTGTISNVGVVGGSVTGSNYVGGLAGENYSGTISNAYATGSVSGNNAVGGLVGENFFGPISNTYATGSVSGNNVVGGLVGENYSGTISNAYATGSVTGSGNFVGGLVGSNYSGPISDAYATGSVSGNNAVGGLVGSNFFGMISDAYATGSVTGSTNVGGLVGGNFSGTISNAYATGSVSGSTNVGGLVGVNFGPISNAYATGSVSGSSDVGGLVGENYSGTISNAYWDTNTGGATGIGGGSTTGATGLSTASLASALPAGFSSSTWGNANNQTTPYLLANASFGTVSGSVILGTDSSATPTAYGVILTLNQLQDINTTGLAGKYVLGANIDASATSGWNGGAGFAPIGNSGATPFSGVFNGLGFTISGLTIDRPGGNDVGLFGYNTGTIGNVGVVGGSVTGSNYVGGLAGENYSGTISNAYATGSVTGGEIVGGLVGYNFLGTISDAYATGSVSGSGIYVGGLVGDNVGGTISDAYAAGSVSGNDDVGGLVGVNSGGPISNAYATGSVSGNNAVGGLVGVNGGGPISNAYATGSVSGNDFVGGLVGSNYNGPISNAYAAGSVTGSDDVGGLVGANGGPISDAYATGSVTGSDDVGGLVGVNGGGPISNAYATGSVSGSGNVGGLVGYNSNGTISNAYWDTNTGGATGIGGGSTTGATGLSTASLASALPAGFSSSTWGNANNQTTPYLLANASFGTVSGSVILGTDSSATPTAYGVILTLNQLQDINTTGLAGKYVLGANIDASATSGWNGGAGFAPIGNSGATPFSGVFNGLGFTISGLTIDRPDGNDVGLFGYNTGTISNVGVVGGSVTGSNYVGGLAGENYSGTISNAYATGSVSGSGSNVGGLVGLNGSGAISNAYATGRVSGSGSNVGGLVGENYSGMISDAYATGSVSGSIDVGGLVGSNFSGTISNAYATGSVSGNIFVGGLVGENYSGTISDAYATGSVTGSSSNGGLVGYNFAGTISNAYWDTNTGGATGIGGGNNTGATGLSTASLASALPAGFSSSTWGNANNQTTPYLLANASFGTVSGSVILGTDSSATPTAYGVILTLNQLQDINTTGLAGKYVLGANIDASATSGWNGGAGFAPIGNSSTTPFSGVFNGLGFTISGLTIDRPDGNDVGLFGYNTGTISNVGVVGGSVTGSNYVGGLAGVNFNGTISNAYATGSVSGKVDVGGLVGFNSGPISNTYATGSVSGKVDVGGLVGTNGGTISDAYATGSVSGNDFVGGLVGGNFSGTISNAYATGSVTGSSDVGGLVGSNFSGTISNAYWDTTTDTNPSANNGIGTGLSTASLASALPAGFSSSTWGNANNQTTPYLLANASFGTVSGSVILGTDSSATPTAYGVILTLNQLQDINTTGLAGKYVLGANIDASATSGWNGGAGFAPIGISSTTPFSGVFNGLGFTISGLTIDRPGSSDVGLFGYNTGAIGNVGVVGGSVTGSNYVGGLAGFNTGTISNAYATGSVTGGEIVGGLAGFNTGTIGNVGVVGGSVSGSAAVGGLVGDNSNGTISNAYATGSVSGSINVGGLVGFNSGPISNTYATGSVSGNNAVGGLVGVNTGTISNAYATGSVTGSDDVGGLVGANGGPISDAYATGSVTGSDDVGGLVGYNYGTISDAYATGSVTGSSSNGGLVGYNFAGTISNAYWDTNTGGATGIGGGNNTGATGLSTASLASALPAGFSSSTWGNANNQTTPYLLANASFGTVSGSVILGTDSSTTPTAYGVILTLNQLQDINTTGLAGKYVLGANIDASATSGWNGGAGFAPIGNSGATPFSGVFNGLGFTISGLTIDRPGGNDVGLFGYNTGTISNVGVVGGSVTGSNYVGGLAGENYSGTISDAYATGSVTGNGDYVGGLVGVNFLGTISDAYATGSVSGNGDYVGGLVGVNFLGTISDAYATGSVSGNDFVGGLVGENYSGTISDAYATGSVTGSSSNGGLVGYNLGGTISDAYATGSVTGSSNGGLVGYNLGGTISNAYWDTNTGGATGIGRGSTTGATGLTAAQMLQSSSYTTWTTSSNNILDSTGAAGKTQPWRIYNGDTMPLLTVFLTPLNVTTQNASQVYNGTVQTSSGGYSVSGSYNPALLLGTPAASSGGQNVGGYALNSGLYSTQQGYDLVITPGTLTITAAVISLSGSQTYNGTTTVQASAFGTIAGVDGQTLTLSGTGTASSANAGTDLSVNPSGLSLGNGSGLASNYTLTGGTDTVTITPATLSASIINNPTAVYNGTTVATLDSGNFSLGGFVSGQGASVTQTVGTYASANAGTGIGVSASLGSGDFTANNGTLLSNYTLPASASGSGTITPATLSASIINNPTAVYNGTTVATLDSGNFSLGGFVSGQGASVTQTVGTYASANAGTGIGVSASLGSGDFTANNGTLLSNYTLPASASGSGTITPATLSASIINNPTAVYNGTTVATLDSGNFSLGGFVSGQGASVTQTVGTYASANAGTGIGVSASLGSGDFTANNGTLLSNYTLPASASGSGTITPATLSASIINNPTAVYNGTTVATLDSGNFSLGGFVSGQGASVTQTVGTYASANAGTGIGVSASLGSGDFTANNGTLLSNYTLPASASGSGTITPATLSASIINNPTAVYNGTTVATLDSGNFSLGGFVSGQGASVTQTVGTYASANAGTGIGVSASLGSGDFTANNGTLLSNYTLPASASGSGTITPATLSASIINNPTAVYNGTTVATLDSGNFSLGGFVSGQGASVTQTVGTYASANAGTGIGVSASLGSGDFTANNGTLLSNYTLPASASGSGTITPATLSASIINNPTAVYNGTTVATLDSGNFSLGGFVSGQGASVTQTVGTYASANAGTGIGVSASLGSGDFTANNGTLLSNYTLPASASGSGTITPATLSASIINNPTAVYNGTTVATLDSGNFSLGGFVSGQGASVTQTVGTYASANAGTGIGVSASLGSGDFTANNGTLLSNYTLPASASGSGTIVAAGPVETPLVNAIDVAEDSMQFGLPATVSGPSEQARPSFLRTLFGGPGKSTTVELTIVQSPSSGAGAGSVSKIQISPYALETGGSGAAGASDGPGT